jgi:hypothetical protein
VGEFDRKWTVDDVGPDGRLNREAVIQAFIEAEAIGHRVGMGVTAVPVRVEYPRDGIVGNGQPEVDTVAWTFKLSRVPLAQRAAAPEVTEPLAVYEAPEIDGPEPPDPEDFADEGHAPEHDPIADAVAGS